jgi:hypothetical protein
MARRSRKLDGCARFLAARHCGGRGFSWQALAWHQRREFESVFSSVNASAPRKLWRSINSTCRAAAPVAASPCNGSGGEQWSFMAGADTRLVSGETNEDVGTFRTARSGRGSGFRRDFRRGGIPARRSHHAECERAPRCVVARDGRRIETSLAPDRRCAMEFQDDRDGIEPSASVELTRRLHERSGGAGFRRHGVPAADAQRAAPAVRVRNDIVEANPELDPERFVSIEGGLEWTPAENLTVSGGGVPSLDFGCRGQRAGHRSGGDRGNFRHLPPGGSGSIRAMSMPRGWPASKVQSNGAARFHDARAQRACGRTRVSANRHSHCWRETVSAGTGAAADRQ